MINLIFELYEEAKEKYKNSHRPNNYIPGYIRKKFDKQITNEQIHKILFQENKDKFCIVCNKKIEYKKFNSISETCSIKCAHNTTSYKENYSKATKGKSKATKGKTYKEIYGTSTPACGFKNGKDNLAKRHDIRKKISEGVKASYNDELRKHRSIQAYNSGFIGGHFKKSINDDYGNNFRSKLEAQFSNFLIKNNVKYEYEKRVNLVNGKVKIVDFVIDDIFIEITGYAYDTWQEDLQKKIIWLRESLNDSDFIFLITYSDKKEKLQLDSIKNKIGHNIFIFDMEELENVIDKIKFVNKITQLNKGLECISLKT